MKQWACGLVYAQSLRLAPEPGVFLRRGIAVASWFRITAEGRVVFGRIRLDGLRHLPARFGANELARHDAHNTVHKLLRRYAVPQGKLTDIPVAAPVVFEPVAAFIFRYKVYAHYAFTSVVVLKAAPRRPWPRPASRSRSR